MPLLLLKQFLKQLLKGLWFSRGGILAAFHGARTALWCFGFDVAAAEKFRASRKKSRLPI